MKHVLSITDLKKEEIIEILDLADKLKEERRKGILKEYLKNKTLGMIFELPSTRTRVSFEVAMNDCGGYAIYMNWNDLQLGRGETIADTARTLSRYVHAVMMRVRRHETLVEFAKFSSVPVINGLSNLEHPCQILADLQTIREKKGSLNVKVAWVGDGNNVCNSLLLASAIIGFEMKLAIPEGFDPPDEILKKAEELGGRFEILRDPKEAVRGADVIYTDVWASMGQEEERERRLKIFRPYQVNMELVGEAKEDVIVMHCLPAHRGEEITDEVIDSEYSVVFDQAENRLHAQKALLLKLIGGSDVG
ncbi:ornithine carbamoyltransferase [Ferroglobus placidus DSM 10642]|uniref:Ornithine carbamoyltransferase n=1 Tax=Ferroglobus placidus (strain DSM 10642 / AEDII12DO) TaxID=589924 RepID=D3RWN1_FERPA|nr:ornithine carbamoyltransferase [Ferroglobus placidus]ADC64894.1 ornithine carbamoyltransferase [Ferroglobus placidus DSM 10642]